MDKLLTPKQRAFFKYFAMGYSRTESAKKAHYKAPRACAQSNIRNHTEAFQEAFDAAGLGFAPLVEKIVAGTEATRTISAVVSETGDQVDASGRSCDFVEVADWNARHKFIDTTIKLQGIYAPIKTDVTSNGKDLIPEASRKKVEDMSVEQLAEFIQDEVKRTGRN